MTWTLENRYLITNICNFTKIVIYKLLRFTLVAILSLTYFLALDPYLLALGCLDILEEAAL